MPEAIGLPLLQAREPEFGLVLLWLLFILIPIAGRIVGWIVRKLAPDGTAPDDPRAAREDPRAAREERQRHAREVQEQGEDLWRRLMRGDEPEEEQASPEPAAPVASAAADRERPATVPAASTRRGPLPEPRRPRIAEPLRQAPSVLPSEERPPSLPEIQAQGLPSSVGEDPFAVDLTDLDVEPTQDEVREVAFALSDRADLVRAIVWSEILGPPVSQRDPGLPGAY